MCVIMPLFLFFFPSSSFFQVCRSPSLLEVMHDVEEKFIPEESEACWQRGLHEAGREAFEEASGALFFGYLNHAVHQASVAPHLRITHTREIR